MFQFKSEKPRRGKHAELCQEHNLRVMNSYYRKRWEHLITYKSGRNESQLCVLKIENEELQGDTRRGVLDQAQNVVG